MNYDLKFFIRAAFTLYAFVMVGKAYYDFVKYVIENRKEGLFRSAKTYVGIFVCILGAGILYMTYKLFCE